MSIDQAPRLRSVANPELFEGVLARRMMRFRDRYHHHLDSCVLSSFHDRTASIVDPGYRRGVVRRCSRAVSAVIVIWAISTMV